MSPVKWSRKCQVYSRNAINFVFFVFLDFLDSIFCVVFKCLDKFFEGKFSPCYCGKKGPKITGREDELSDSFYGRSNIFSRMGFLPLPRKWNESNVIKPAVGNGQVKNRWSDCNCETCLFWVKDGGEKLYVVTKEPSRGSSIEKPVENVIFIHGFLSSSSFWTESVFQNLSEDAKSNYRLFAFDLLGFGRSPKPMDCLYTLKDHLDMIENSIIKPYELKSFHLVAHSMGCIIALAMAFKYSKFINSVTLVAPAYFSCYKDETSLEVLKRIAGKKLWPPKAFHWSVTAWYEHLGRSFCFLLCRHHRTIGKLIRLLTKRRELSFATKDLVMHTHHSVWHCIHNVVCGEAKNVDGYLEILGKSSAKINIIHGDRDNAIPIDCSYNIKRKIPQAAMIVVPYATHNSVIFRRKKEFTESLERFWASRT